MSTHKLKNSGTPEEFQELHDHILTCSKCGFCQANCPIFLATGREGHVARGKVALYRNMLEGRLELGPDVKDAFANCLQCRACIENCVPAIQTDDVVVSFRHAYGDRFGRGLLQRWVFRILLKRPRLMRTLVRMVWAFRRTGLVELARRVGLVGLLNPKLERALELGAEKPGRLLTSRLARRPPRESAGRPLVGYWISCGYNYVLPEVGESTVRVLERMGFAVEVLDNCCCGLAAYGYGDLEAAATLARENLRRLGDLKRFDAIVSDCGSCSGHLKEYGRILADDPEWVAKVKQLEGKMRSFSEFVIEQGGIPSLQGTDSLGPDSTGATGRKGAFSPGGATAPEGAASPTITFHEPCHLGRRYQNVVDQPRQLLRSLPGATFEEMEEADSCCGAAGTYGVLHPDTSAAIIDRKMDRVRATGASVVATECPSCMMQLRLGARRTGSPVSVLGVSQLCDRATQPEPGSATEPE